MAGDDYVLLTERALDRHARGKSGRIIELTTKQIEQAILIREWGSMSMSGLGLGYGSCTLNTDTGGEPPLSVEEFERINRAVENLPLFNSAVIKHLYKFNNPLRETARRMARSKAKIEEAQKVALGMLYNDLCRIS